MPSEQPSSVWDDNDGTGEMCDTPAQGATDKEIAAFRAGDGHTFLTIDMLLARLDHEIAARRKAEEERDAAVKRAFDEGFNAGESKQAMLEVKGRERFVQSLRDKLCPKCIKATGGTP